MADAAEEQNDFSGEEEYEYEEVEVEEEVDDDEEGGEETEGVGGGQKREHGLDSNTVVTVVDSVGIEAKPSAYGSSSEGKIFVGGVAWETAEETFQGHFKKYGEITDAVIMKNKQTGAPRGFGFITFADPSVIDEVLKDEHVIDGRTVEVKRTVPRTTASSIGNPKTKKIFVGGLPSSLTEDEFKEYFSSYGNVLDHQIMVDHSTGRSRGFGFITFEKESTVEEIMTEDKVHELGGKQVELKRAVPKKTGGEPNIGRASYGHGGGNTYGAYGALGYGGGYQAAAYGVGRGYGYGYGFGPGYAGAMYGYGAGGGYGGQGGYGAFYNGGYPAGRYGGGRYHPYGR